MKNYLYSKISVVMLKNYSNVIVSRSFKFTYRGEKSSAINKTSKRIGNTLKVD